jgi:hypothetical protein
MSDPYDRFRVTEKENEMMVVCVYCEEVATPPVCEGCNEYKGLMTVGDWEDYTGEKWEG